MLYRTHLDSGIPSASTAKLAARDIRRCFDNFDEPSRYPKFSMALIPLFFCCRSLSFVTIVYFFIRMIWFRCLRFLVWLLFLNFIFSQKLLVVFSFNKHFLNIEFGWILFDFLFLLFCFGMAVLWLLNHFKFMHMANTLKLHFVWLSCICEVVRFTTD